jgi:hypothetical protein
MARNILHKKYYDLHDELYYIASNLIVKNDPDNPEIGLKPYVQWSKNDIQPLEDAIEALVQRVRDDTKAGRRSLPELSRRSSMRPMTKSESRNAHAIRPVCKVVTLSRQTP